MDLSNDDLISVRLECLKLAIPFATSPYLEVDVISFAKQLEEFILKTE
jgi:hypothetical protein